MRSLACIKNLAVCLPIAACCVALSSSPASAATTRLITFEANPVYTSTTYYPPQGPPVTYSRHTSTDLVFEYEATWSESNRWGVASVQTIDDEAVPPEGQSFFTRSSTSQPFIGTPPFNTSVVARRYKATVAVGWNGGMDYKDKFSPEYPD